MRLIKRCALCRSSDNELRHIVSDSALTNCRLDEIIAKNTNVTNAKKSLKAQHVLNASQHLINLKYQGLSLKEIHNTNIFKANISVWSKAVEALPGSKLIFAHKALSQVLSTAAKFVRWKRSTDPSCHLCASGNADK